MSPNQTSHVSYSPWVLEHDRIYYVKKLESLICVEVKRQDPAGETIAHLVVLDIKSPQQECKTMLSRQKRYIRERQVLRDLAESVVVRDLQTS